MTTLIPTRFQLRRDTSANWINANPQLLSGELGFEIDTGKIKIGNDSNWNSITNYIADVGSITNVNNAITTLQSKLTNFVSVKDFGATGTGALISTAYPTLALAQAYYGDFVTSLSQTLDWAGIQKAINTGNLSIYIPSGTYVLGGDAIRVNSSSLRIYGTGATSILTSTARSNIIELQSCSSVSFTDIAFTGNFNTSGADGVIRTTATSVIQDVTFERCFITTSTFATNGGYFPATVNQAITNLKFIRCNFLNIGRNGIEVTNNGGGSTSRYTGVTVDQCKFTVINGSAGVILNGIGNQSLITANIFDRVVCAIQLQGASDTTVSFNKFQAFLSGGCPFKFNGSIAMTRNVVTGNTTEASATADTEFNLQRNLVLSGNYLSHTGSAGVKITNSQLLRASEEIYVGGATASISCILSGPSSDSRFVNCTFDSSANASGIGFQVNNPDVSSIVTNTMMTNCMFSLGSSGVIYNTAGSAVEAPQIFLSKKTQAGVATLLQGDPIPIGNNWRNALTKSVSGGTSTSIEIDFGTSSTSVPACVSLRVMSSKSDGSFKFRELRYWIVHITGTVTVNQTTLIGGGTLGLDTSSSGNKLTITATESPSDTYTFLWDIDVDSVNVPIVV
jgi:hypothetical protein